MPWILMAATTLSPKSMAMSFYYLPQNAGSAVVSDLGVFSPAHWSSEKWEGRMRRESFETAERQGMKLFCKMLELTTT